MHYNKKGKAKEQSCSFFIEQDILEQLSFLSEFYHTSKSRVIEASLRSEGRENEIFKIKSRCFKKAKKIHFKPSIAKKNQIACKEAQMQSKCLFDFACE